MVHSNLEFMARCNQVIVALNLTVNYIVTKSLNRPLSIALANVFSLKKTKKQAIVSPKLTNIGNCPCELKSGIKTEWIDDG